MKTEPLVENINVRQRNDEGFRRWFINAFFELIIWYDKKDGELYGFQFCYSRNDHEKVYTWTKDYESSHKVSDSNSGKGLLKLGTAILQDDGGLIPETVINKYREESTRIEPRLNAFILEKINAYNGKRLQVELPPSA